MPLLMVNFGEYTKKMKLTTHFNSGKIQIKEIDDETNKPIEGVEFELLDLNGNVIQTSITNEQGEAIFENLTVGKYQLKEKSTNQDYIMNMQTTEVEIKNDEIMNKEIKSKRKKGNIQIYKVDKENHQIALEGVTFELYSRELDKVIGTYTTDEKGKIFISNLRIGEYELRETVAQKEYEIGENVNISIEWEKTIDVTIENKKIIVDIPDKEEPDRKDEPQIPDQKEEPDEKNEPQSPEQKEESDDPSKEIEQVIAEKKENELKKLPKTGY